MHIEKSLYRDPQTYPWPKVMKQLKLFEKTYLRKSIVKNNHKQIALQFLRIHISFYVCMSKVVFFDKVYIELFTIPWLLAIDIVRELS